MRAVILTFLIFSFGAQSAGPTGRPTEELSNERKAEQRPATALIEGIWLRPNLTPEAEAAISQLPSDERAKFAINRRKVLIRAAKFLNRSIGHLGWSHYRARRLVNVVKLQRLKLIPVRISRAEKKISRLDKAEIEELSAKAQLALEESQEEVEVQFKEKFLTGIDNLLAAYAPNVAKMKWFTGSIILTHAWGVALPNTSQKAYILLGVGLRILHDTETDSIGFEVFQDYERLVSTKTFVAQLFAWDMRVQSGVRSPGDRKIFRDEIFANKYLGPFFNSKREEESLELGLKFGVSLIPGLSFAELYSSQVRRRSVYIDEEHFRRLWRDFRQRLTGSASACYRFLSKDISIY